VSARFEERACKVLRYLFRPGNVFQPQPASNCRMGVRSVDAVERDNYYKVCFV